MKSLTYIFAIIFSLVITSSSFATDKVKEKNPKNNKTVVLRTEIVSLIEEDASLEVDRNLVLDSLTIASNFISNLIEEDAATEVDTQLDTTNVSLQLGNLENLAENNANVEVDSQLTYKTIHFDALQNLIDSNVKAEECK